MADPERLAARLAAVERALTDADVPPADLPDAAAVADRLDALEDRLEGLDDRVTELSAGLRAVRGYVGNVDAVDDAVERRADAALAAVERLEARTGREVSGASDQTYQDGSDGATDAAVDELFDVSADDALDLATDGRGWVDAGAMGGRHHGDGSTTESVETTDDGASDADAHRSGRTADGVTGDGTRGPGWTAAGTTPGGRAGEGSRAGGATDAAVETAVTGAASGPPVGDGTTGSTDRAIDGGPSGGRRLLDRLREVL